MSLFFEYWGTRFRINKRCEHFAGQDPHRYLGYNFKTEPRARIMHEFAFVFFPETIWPLSRGMDTYDPAWSSEWFQTTRREAQQGMNLSVSNGHKRSVQCTGILTQPKVASQLTRGHRRYSTRDVACCCDDPRSRLLLLLHLLLLLELRGCEQLGLFARGSAVLL